MSGTHRTLRRRWLRARRNSPRRRSSFRFGVLAVSVANFALVGQLTVSDIFGAGRAGASTSATLTVSPASGLVDGQTVSVVVSGASPGTVYVAVECDPQAFTLLGQGASPADGCEARHNAVITVDAGGVAAAIMQPRAVLTTSLGSSDCRTQQCFVAVQALFSTGGPALLLQNISFAPSACTANKSCNPPADSWDPQLGAASSSFGQRTTSTATDIGTPPATAATRARTSTPTAVPGKPVALPIMAGQAGDLTAAGAVTGPYGSAFPPPVVPTTPVAGEGLLRLALSAPHTSWGSPLPNSTVVDVALTDVTTSTLVGTQQFVLYSGPTTFTYGGFTGPVTTAHSYRVTVTAEASHTNGGQSWTNGRSAPKATVVDSQLEVADPSNPQYLAVAYAPVMYGRSTSALHDVPLLVDATATPVAGGSTHLSYTIIWSHEDAGTGFVPFLEWGTWGRMTDIENAISFTVASDGSTSGASYLWGGEPATGFPDSQGALQEVDQPFTGQWDGHHPILRDATGNNDFSVAGTTPFRFQLAPVPGPSSGQTRESVMDAHPFTYQISGGEVTRWYGDVSLDPRSPQPGDARQYATIDLDASGTGVSALAVELQLSGGATWYASDFHSGYPAHGAGHFRTVVKLPTGWQGQSITGARVQAYPATAAPSVVINSMTVLALQQDWSLTAETIPAPSVVPGVTEIPTSLDLSALSGSPQTVRRGRMVRPLEVTVVDSLGNPLAGVAVTFSAGVTGAAFTGCGCPTLTVASDKKGRASSGRAIAPSTVGHAMITASTVDTAASQVAFDINVTG